MHSKRIPQRRVHSQVKPLKGERRGSRTSPTLVFLTIVVFAGGCLTGVINSFQKDLPPLSRLERYQPSLITKIYSADDRLLKEFYVQKRVLVPLDEMPPYLINAVLDIEDRRFWNHWGIDLRRVLGALWYNLKAKRMVQGASTLTQQLARNLFLTPERTPSRKIKEALTALQIEKTYSKREILQMYLNQQYLGHGAYGVQSAAQLYFGKDAKDLDLSESALLAGLLKGPGLYSPINHPKKALWRRNLVLGAMVECGHLSPAEADSAMQSPLVLNSNQHKQEEAPYFVEYVRQQLEEQYGSSILYQDGVSVYTTLDLRLQHIAEQVMEKYLQRLEKRMEAQRKDTLQSEDTLAVDSTQVDSIYTPRVQGALVAIDPHTGEIKALVGGRDFRESKFNRAVQARRQPGSAFKPFVYTAAMDNGYRPTDVILDAPVAFPLPDGELWIPQNYDSTSLGPMTLRDGLRLSRNLVAIRLLQKIKPKRAISYARRMGIKSPLQPVPSLAIGTSEVTPLELTAAYATFANGGFRIKPFAIRRIVDQDGYIVEENRPHKEEVLSAQTDYMMIHMLKSVIDAGTGYGARRAGFKRPAAGKTGTTDNFTDAWFVGFTPYLVAGVWVGFDDQSPLGERMAGSVAALPIWTAFMKAAHDTLELPPSDFEVPPGIVKRAICRDSYELATDSCPNTYTEIFIKGTEPTEFCHLHSPVAGQSSQEGAEKEKQEGIKPSTVPGLTPPR